MGTRLALWALRMMRQRVWRSVVISISLAISVATLIVFFAVHFRVKEIVQAAENTPYQRLWIVERASSNSMQIIPLALEEQLAKLPGVKAVVYGAVVIAIIPDGEVAIGIGASDNLLEFEGDIFPTDASAIARWKSDRMAAIVPQRLAERLKIGVGDLYEMPTATGAVVKFRVAGISNSAALSFRFVLHYDYVDELMGRHGIVNDYRIIIDRGQDYRPVMSAVDALLASRGLPSQLTLEDTMLRSTGSNQASMIPTLLGVMGLLLLLTTGAAIVNSTVISMRQRRAELATLRVLGFKKRTIGALVVGESLAVCAIGGAVGIGLAYAVMKDGISIGSWMFQAIPLSRTGILAGVACSLAIPVLGGAYSAWLAVRAPVAQALRDAG